MDLVGSAPPRPIPYLRLLLWLKWRLTWRSYKRNSSALFGLLIMLLVFLPWAGAAAVGSYLGYTYLAPPDSAQLLRGVLLGIYVFWIVVPLMGFALNDSYDITRLFVYPLTVRQIVVGAILGSLIDFPVVLLLPALLAALIAFTPGLAGGLLIGVALLLFLFHTLSLSQSLIIATAGMMKSRRYRDIIMVLFPALWILYYVGQELFRRSSVTIPWRAILSSPLWEALGYLPPGLAAHAAASASQGDFAAATGYTGALAVITVGTVMVASAFIKRVYAGETSARRKPEKPLQSSATVAKPSHSAAPASATVATKFSPGLAARLLPSAAYAVYRKEWRYITRDPYFKVAFMNLCYMLAVAIFMVIPRSPGDTNLLRGPGVVWGATSVVLLSEMRFVFNNFGTEGAAAPLLFLFPASRREILIGKNAVYLLALSAINFPLVLVLCAISGAIGSFPVIYVWMLLSTLIFIGIGNPVSCWLPMRLVVRGRQARSQSVGQGCSFASAYFGISMLAYLFLIPVLAALLVPSLWVNPAWLFLTIPAAAVYTFGLYAWSLKMAEPLVYERELEIISKVAGEV